MSETEKNCICPVCGLKNKSLNTRDTNDKTRIALFIDGGNMYHAVKLLGFKIDFEKLRSFFIDDNNMVSQSFYYSAYDPNQGFIVRILDWLRHNDFIVRTKPVKSYPDLTEKGNLDVEMVLDMILKAQHYDTAVLVSGDGDFTRCVRELQHQLGKRVIVVSSEKTKPSLCSKELKQQANDFIELADIQTAIQQ